MLEEEVDVEDGGGKSSGLSITSGQRERRQQTSEGPRPTNEEKAVNWHEERDLASAVHIQMSVISRTSRSNRAHVQRLMKNPPPAPKAMNAERQRRSREKARRGDSPP